MFKKDLTPQAGPKVSCVMNPEARQGAAGPETRPFGQEEARSARRFHQTFPDYRPTPLVALPHLADRLGIKSVRVKDESRRFSLNSFKILGASYALAAVIAQRLGMATADLSSDMFRSPDIAAQLKDTTFVAATDGNHGRAVAWGARQLGCRAVIFAPRGATQARIEAIERYGAEVSVADGNYDETLRLVIELAEKRGWVHVQDQAWEGYEDIPTRTMQGYLTLMDEASEQMGEETASHVIAPCGAGAFSAAVQAYLVERFGRLRPMMAVVEPVEAACYFHSMSAGGKEPRVISGELDTIMAGLSCGEVSSVGWPILSAHTDAFFACADHVARTGMRILAAPLPGDESVVSGESGAVTLGLLAHLCRDPACRDVAAQFGLDRDSNVLLISTEGDTDPALYRRIVWGCDF